jgi:hypothetical protein
MSVAAAAPPADDCECDRYRALVETSGLAAEATAAGLVALHTEGADLSDEARRARLLLRDALAMIPEKCRERLLNQSQLRLSVVLRGVLGPDASVSTSWDMADNLLDKYHAVVNLYAGACTPPGTYKHPIVSGEASTREPGKWVVTKDDYVNCLLQKRQQAFQSTSKILLLQSTAHISNAVAIRAGMTKRADPLSGLSTGDIEVLKLYDGAINSGSQAQMRALLEGARDRLNDQQKLALGLMLGYRWWIDYSSARENSNASGVVSIDQLLAAARKNTVIGYYDKQQDAIVKKDAAFAGICRDIASAQATVWKYLGLRNTYVLSQALRSGEYHVTAVAEGTKDSGAVYHGNYDALHVAKGGDARAAMPGTDEIAINYRAFKPGDRMVADIQSPMGKFLNVAAGGDVRAIDPLSHVDGQLLAADVGVGAAGSAHVRAGAGTDGAGGTYWFGAASKSYGLNSQLPGRAALVIGSQSKDPADWGGSGARVNYDFIYAELEQHFQSRDLKLSPSTIAKIDTMAYLVFMAGRARDGDNPGALSAQGDLRISEKASIEQKFWNDRARAKISAGFQISPGIPDIRDNHVPGPVYLSFNHLFLTAEGRMRLLETPEGRAYLVATATVLFDQLGVRGRAEAGVVGDKAGATVTLEGRLTEDTAMIQDGSGRAISANLFLKPHKAVRAGLSATAPLEKGTGVGPRVMGNVAVEH